MDHYVDIRYKENKKVPQSKFISVVMNRLHIQLVDSNSDFIGISFPNINNQDTGDTIRLHGDKEKITDFMISQWIGSISDLADISKILTIPKKHKHIMVSRVNQKKTRAKLRRLKKRHNISKEEELEYKLAMYNEQDDYPSISMKSHSSGKLYPLKIKQEASKKSTGSFNTFGLSNTATVPFF